MTRRHWLLLVAACGAGIFSLSFVNGWIVHERELRGEGYRHALTVVSAWRGVGVPVLALGAVAALVTAVVAIGLAVRQTRRGWPVIAGSVVVAGTLLATAVPLGQDAHASSVDLSAGILLPIGVVLAIGMLAGSLVAMQPRTGVAAALAVLGVAVLAGATGARWLGLQLGEGSGRHWSEGSYTRAAIGAEPTESLTIGDGTFTIAERWSGTWEWSGWTVVLDQDPACPDSRGTYHAHGVADEDLRFVKVVDTCADGGRAADLETGVWERDP
jgi:hypothetical protein